MIGRLIKHATITYTCSVCGSAIRPPEDNEAPMQQQKMLPRKPRKKAKLVTCPVCGKNDVKSLKAHMSCAHDKERHARLIEQGKKARAKRLGRKDN